jgi:hypothetical protein
VIVYNAVVFGIDFVYGSKTAGPFFYIVGYDDGYPWDVIWDGVGHLDMDLYVPYDYFVFTHYEQDCGYADYGAYFGSLDAGGGAGEDIPCDSSAFDVWAFEATAGQTLQVAVDNGATADPNEVLSTTFRLTDDANCFVEEQAGALLCTNQPGLPFAPTTTYPESTAYCGTIEDTVAATGTYHLLVGGYAFSCASGGNSPYTLTGNLDGTPVAFSLLADDAPYVEDVIQVDEIADFQADVTYTP